MGPLPALDGTDPETREAFADATGMDVAALATRYSEGDVVDTPDGVGVVATALTESSDEGQLEDVANVPDTLEASSDAPLYAVVTEQPGQPVRFYPASDLSATDIETDVDAVGGVNGEDAEAACPVPDGEQTAELAWSPPASWRDADTPARVIALDAFSSMGGKHGGSDASGGCVGTMRGQVGDPDRWRAGFLDYLYGGYDFWRGDSFLPGD
jgi:hypothetical protein